MLTAFRSNGDSPNSCKPPQWAYGLVGDCPDVGVAESHGVHIRCRAGREFTLTSASASDARGFDSGEFQRCVENLYDGVFEAVGARQVVRLWNFIPGICNPIDDFDQRYKVFNIGRFNSFNRRFGGDGESGRQFATASGIGTTSSDLVVHALAAVNPAEPVENPRQIPSYRYSETYGPLPPCFARAMRIQGDVQRLLVGGTASIRGEETVHINNPDKQLDETILNLAAVVGAGLGMVSIDCDFEQHTRHLLERYQSLRVYSPDSLHLDSLVDRMQASFPGLSEIEFMQAELCRPGLIVEIEGWADLGGSTFYHRWPESGRTINPTSCS